MEKELDGTKDWTEEDRQLYSRLIREGDEEGRSYFSQAAIREVDRRRRKK